MIKFFRKIRQQLLTQNKFTKYIFYAVGEIVLVVIGILIAISVNNWNEKRNNDISVHFMFENILEELEYDIHLAGRQIKIFKSIDSLITKVLNKEVSIADYNSEPSYTNLISPLFSLNIDDFSVENIELLINNSDIVTAQFKNELKIIRDIYINDIEDIKISAKKLEEYITQTENEYRQNHIWYSETNEEHKKQKIKFQLTDPKYLNNVKHLQLLNFGIFFSYNIFKTNAIVAYNEIHKTINSQRIIPDYIPAILKPSREELLEYIGTYHSSSQNITYKIGVEKFYLTLDVRISKNGKIFKTSKDIFIFEIENAKLEFKRNVIGDIIGFDFIYNGEIITKATKIKIDD